MTTDGPTHDSVESAAKTDQALEEKKASVDAPRSETHASGTVTQAKPTGHEARDWWKVVVETLTLLAVIWYASVASKQRDEMHNATKAATRSADAAKSAADTAAGTLEEIRSQTTLLRQQVTGTLAATVPEESPFPHSISADLQLLNYTGIGMNFRNIGKVQASRFIANATLARRNLPEYRPLGISQHKQTAKLQISPYEQTAPPGTLAESANIRFDTEKFTEADIKKLHGLEETIEISGDLQYDNGFGDTVHRPFCFLYATIPSHVFVKSGAGTGGPGDGGWYPCEGAKDMIGEALKWKQKDH